MTIGIAAFGAGAGRGVIAALKAVECVGRGAIGGFVSFAAIKGDGSLVRASTQTGGAGTLFNGHVPDEIAVAHVAGLISSGPNRPDPLSDFIAAEPGVGIVTGHRMPQTRMLDGVALNVHVLREMKAGADPQSAVDQVIATCPDMDAGFLACSFDGRMGMGSTPAVMMRGDLGSGLLEVRSETKRVASIHNAIHPHRLISTVANEIALDTMTLPETPVAWIRVTSGVALHFGPNAQVQVGSNGSADRLVHPNEAYLKGEWSIGLGDRVAVLADGRTIGWLGYEPFMIVADGRVQSVDGQKAIDIPVTSLRP